MTVDYSIWTLCFAKGRLPGDFVGGSPVMSNQGTFEIPMIYSAIVPATHRPGDRDVILVDTGFAGGKSMTGREFADYETPAQTLAKIDLRPEEVSTVLLTHLHFDHAGNLAAFPEARVYLQRCEYDGWKAVMSRYANTGHTKNVWALSSMNPGDLDRVDEVLAQDRLTFVDGDAEVAPGITCRLAADTHTFGSQWLTIQTAKGPYVLTGDCAYWYANIERMWPPGYIQGNTWRMLEAYEKILAAVDGDLGRVVVGHDMAIFERHRSAVIGRNPVATIHRAIT